MITGGFGLSLDIASGAITWNAWRIVDGEPVERLKIITPAGKPHAPASLPAEVPGRSREVNATEHEGTVGR